MFWILVRRLLLLLEDEAYKIKILKKFKIKIIEDAAEALGTFYKKKHAIFGYFLRMCLYLKAFRSWSIAICRG